MSSPSSKKSDAKKTAAITKASTLRPHYDQVIAKWEAAVPKYFEWCQQKASVQEKVDNFKDELLGTDKYEKLIELNLIKPKNLTKDQKREKGNFNKELNKEVSAHRRPLSEKIDKNKHIFHWGKQYSTCLRNIKSIFWILAWFFSIINSDFFADRIKNAAPLLFENGK